MTRLEIGPAFLGLLAIAYLLGTAELSEQGPVADPARTDELIKKASQNGADLETGLGDPSADHPRLAARF